MESPVTKSKGLLIGWLAVLAASPALSAEANVLREVRLEGTPSGARVVVTGSRAPIFTVFRLGGPDRLVIDVTSADATAIRGARDGQGPIAGLNVSQFTDSTSSVGRVMVTLRDAKSYDVKADGNLLLVSVVGEGASNAPLASAPPAAPAPRAAAPAAVAPAAAAARCGSGPDRLRSRRNGRGRRGPRLPRGEEPRLTGSPRLVPRATRFSSPSTARCAATSCSASPDRAASRSTSPG